jgi:hypothetical protein
MPLRRVQIWGDSKGTGLRLLPRSARQYSIRINDQWRICFRWVSRDALDVEIVDYHKGR